MKPSDEAMRELLGALNAISHEEGVAIFEHSAEEMGLMVMENHEAIRAVIDRALSPAMDAQPTADAATVEAVARAICIALGDDPDREEERLTAYDAAALAAIRQLAPRNDVAGIVAWLRNKVPLHLPTSEEQAAAAVLLAIAAAIERGDFRQQGEG